MSTYLYLECLSHDPPLRAQDESGQHLYDLPQIRADVANRDELAAEWRVADCDVWTMLPRPASFLDDDQYFRRRTIEFLGQHPHCHIGIRDEYGEEHAVAEQAARSAETGLGATNRGGSV